MDTKSGANKAPKTTSSPAVTTAEVSKELAGRPLSLVQRVVDGIIHGVSRGTYVPGQRLIAADLAREFDVRRAPVREALAVLAGEGVVENIPNRGAQIRRLGVDQLSDFMEFTEAICRLGIRRASSAMRTPEAREEISQAFENIEKYWSRRSAPEFVNALYEYHETLNRLSGNTFLDFFYRRPYFTFFNRLVADLVPDSDEVWEHYISHYRSIHQKVLGGNVERAEAEFVSHIGWVLEIMRAGDSSRPR